MAQIPRTRLGSYLLVAALAAATASFHLGPALVAGLFSYTALAAAHRRLAGRLRPAYARWLSVCVFALVAAGALLLLGWFLGQSLAALPAIVDQAAPKLVELGGRYGLALPVDDAPKLRRLLLDRAGSSAAEITRAGGLLTAGFFRLLIAVFIAVLCFLENGPEQAGDSFYDGLRRETAERIRLFARSFARVMGAQVTISAVNTGFTAAFLLSLGLPHAAFLIPATFLLGLLPVIGNLLSNTLIVGTALTVSPRQALFALAFLVLIHKGEYFLNSRIVGSSIRAPMWQTLLSLFLGEALLGVPGIILGPAVHHYLRVEMENVPDKTG